MLKKPFLPIPADDINRYTHKKNQIDVWQFQLNASLPCPAESILSPDEIQRAARFHFEHHRHYFIRARITLRNTLAAYLKQPPESIVFDYGPKGKPFLKDYPLLSFNLSHSHHQALLIIGQTYPVGIDIEHYAARPYAGIGRHVFSLEENEKLSQLPESLKPFMFFNTWAQKEAFIKYLGLGLSYPVEQLTVNNLANTAYTLHCPREKVDCIMMPFMPLVGYAAAICYHPKIQSIRYHQLA